jgi:hypothetical protein
MRFPAEIKPGQKVKGLVQLNDITTTILTQAGFKNDEIDKCIPNSTNLISFLQVKDENYKWRNYAVYIYRTNGIYG